MSVSPPQAPSAPPTYPVAGLGRRFYALVFDRIIGWGLIALASWLAYHFLISRDRFWPGIAAIAGATLFVWLIFAIALGSSGATPGKAMMGLRAVQVGTGTTIGVGRALLRGAIVGIATIPTFGLGVATLAWTAVMDQQRRRRGWHDQVAKSIVVDVRPEPIEESQADRGPRHVVNLTAMRLIPAPQSAPPPAVPSPVRVERAPSPEPHPAPAPQPSSFQPAGPPPGLVPTPRGPLPASPPLPGPESAPMAAPAVARTVRRGEPADGVVPIPQWRVAFDTGESFAISGLVLVGRRPEARVGEQVERLLSLPSTDMSLSKTHAQVQVAIDGALVVMDRGSTNGSVLVRKGLARQLTGGRPTTLLEGDVVRFGDRQMRVSRG